jgi:phosphoenolpyruvate carboxykinase (GTP)
VDGTGVGLSELEQLFDVDPASWLAEAAQLQEHFDGFGDRLPAALQRRLDELVRRMEGA